MAGDEPLVIGVDVGGTKVAAGLVNSSGEIVCQTRRPMVADKAPEIGLASVTDAIDALQAEHAGSRRVSGIGICSPGPLDPKTGVVLNPPNLPCWHNFPLREGIEKLYQLPVKVDNDANAAALAEARWGAGRGYRNVFYATIGTGIGTGIILDGRIYHGHTGAAGEGGHISIDYRGPRCACGKRGCVEAFAAGPAIARRARTKLRETGEPSKMLELADGNIEGVTSEVVSKANAQKDALAHEILSETVDFLAFWLGNMIDLLDPEALVLGGGVASMLDPFLPELEQQLPRHSVNPRCHDIRVLMAHYGADSGIAGGAALCAGDSPPI